MSLDVSTQNPVHGSQFHSFRLDNAYSINSADGRVHSIPLELLFPDVVFPLLVVGDLNILNHLPDPLRSFSSLQISSSAPDFDFAAPGGFAFLKPPSLYTRFPLSGRARPSVIDLVFAKALLLPFLKRWDTLSLPPALATSLSPYSSLPCSLSRPPPPQMIPY